MKTWKIERDRHDPALFLGEGIGLKPETPEEAEFLIKLFYQAKQGELHVDFVNSPEGPMDATVNLVLREYR